MYTKFIAVTAVAIIAIAAINRTPETAPEFGTSGPSQQEKVDTSAQTGKLQNLADAHLQAEQSPSSDKTEAVQKQYGYLSVAEYESASIYGQLPQHLRGISLQKLFIDSQGNLIVTEDLKQLIEQFLLGSEDEGLDQMIARIKEYIELILPASAAIQALAIVDQYVEYKHRAAEEAPINGAEQDLDVLAKQIETTLDQRKRIRRESLPESVVVAFFDNEERYDDFNLTRLKVNSNKALSDSEKDALLAQAELSLPEKTQKRMRYVREEKKLNKQIELLKSKGNRKAEIHQLRTDFYGKETAERIAYFEDDSDQWNNRVAMFNQDKQSILQQQNLSQQQQTDQIASIKASLFTEKEQVKLAVQNIRNKLGHL